METNFFGMQELAGEVALITGGASGIGRATAELFASAGMPVMIADLNADNGARTVATISEHGGKASAVVTDVTDLRSCEHAVAETLACFGRFDVLVNSAGIVIPDDTHGPVPEALRMMIDVNTMGTFNMMSASLVHFCRQQRGNIINMGSVAGELGIPGRVGYCISKAGVHLATKSEALRVAPFNVRVNAIAPCRVYTELVEGYLRANENPARMLRSACSTQVSGIMAEPRDIARAALFLASSWSSVMTGAILDLTNGWLAGHQGNPASLPPRFEEFRRLVESKTGLSV